LNWRKGCVGGGVAIEKACKRTAVHDRTNPLELRKSRGNFVSRISKRWKHKGTPEMRMPV